MGMKFTSKLNGTLMFQFNKLVKGLPPRMCTLTFVDSSKGAQQSRLSPACTCASKMCLERGALSTKPKN
eukprot:1136789-Pelagomonas_calceolata.AAC.4